MAPRAFVADEFNEGPLSALDHWGYSAYWHLGKAPWTFYQLDPDLFNEIENGKLVQHWKADSCDTCYRYQEINQGRVFDPEANPPYGDWIYYGLTGALDIYTKIRLPSTTGMTGSGSGGGNVQFVLMDEGFYGPGIWAWHGDDVGGSWQWVIASWIVDYDDNYEESAYIGLGTGARDIWFRMTWPLDGTACKIYYSLVEPTEESWVNLTPPTYPLVPNGTDLPYLQVFSQGNSFNLSEDLDLTYEYIKRWVEKRQIRGWQIDFNKSVPAKVSDMKDGEWRMTEGGIYARVGNQVLQKSWIKTLMLDDFEDGIIDDNWKIYSYKGGGAAAESGGFLAITVYGGTSGAQYQRFQDGIEGIGSPILVKGTYYFDIWGQLIGPADPVTDSNRGDIALEFYSVSVLKDYLRIFLQEVSNQYRVTIFYHDGTTGASFVVSPDLPLGLGANELWWRMRFMPGDSKIRIFLTRGSKSPHKVGWTEYTSLMTKGSGPSPVGNDEMRFKLGAYNWSPTGGQDDTWYFNEVADWNLEQITTTTTTTTTT